MARVHKKWKLSMHNKSGWAFQIAFQIFIIQLIGQPLSDSFKGPPPNNEYAKCLCNVIQIKIGFRSQIWYRMLLFWESLQGCQLESKAALVVACCWEGGRICSWSLQQGPPKMKDCAIFEIHFNISNPTPSRANFVVAFKANGTKLQIKARNFWKHSAN